MASLSTRSKRAGLIQGFFGQKNRNTDRRAKLEDRFKELDKQAVLERSKSRYEAQAVIDRERAEWNGAIIAAGGVFERSDPSSGFLTGIGKQMLAERTIPNWANMTGLEQNAVLKKMGNRRALDVSTALFGPRTNTSKVGKIFTGESSSRNENVNKLGKLASLEVFQTNKSGPQLPGPAVEPAVDAVNTGLLGFREEADQDATFTRDGRSIRRRLFADGRVLEEDVGAAPSDIAQSGKTFVLEEDPSRTVQTIFDENLERHVAIVDGKRDPSVNLIPADKEADAASRIAGARNIEKRKNIHKMATTSVFEIRNLITSVNPADYGAQGAINEVFGSLGAFLNPAMTVEEGAARREEILTAFGVDKSLSTERQDESIEAAKKRVLNKQILNSLGFSGAATEEQEEILALASRASNNVATTILVFRLARIMTGDNTRTNTKFVEMISSIIPVGGALEKTLGGLVQLEKQMYDEASRGSGDIVEGALGEEIPNIGNRLVDGRLYRSKSNTANPGWLFRIADPKREISKSPTYVFLDSVTGKPILMSFQETIAFNDAFQATPVPSGVPSR